MSLLPPKNPECNHFRLHEWAEFKCNWTEHQFTDLQGLENIEKPFAKQKQQAFG